MLKMVDGSGIIGVDMICPLGVSTPQPPNYDRVELEGVGMLVLPNSLDAPLERLELGGKTEQLNTRGVNLWRSDSTVIVSGVKYVMFDNPIQTGTYTLSAIFANDKSASESLFSFYNEQNQNVGGGTIKQGGRQSKTFTLTGKAVKVLFYASSGYDSSQGVTTTIKEIQLETGTTATPYEPYTGGKPSPSPEYPQEIKNSGKWNEEKQKYEVDVKITGKNLLDTYGKAEKDSEFYSVNDDGSLNQKKVDNRSFLTVPETLFLRAGKYYFSLFDTGITFQLYNADANKVFLVIEKQESILVDLEKDTNIKYKVFNSSGTANNVRVMVSINKETDYVPCKEPQSLTLTSDRPLTKWDRLVEQGGQIGWLYKSKVYDGFDGENNRIELGNKVGNVRHFSVYFASTPNSVGNANSYCDKYIGVNVSWTKEKFGIFCDWNNGVKFFSAPNEKVTNLEEFKAWLIENPLKIAYETTNPEFIPLPQSEQNAIRVLKTYYPTTVITVDGGELDPDIKATYRKEI